MHKRNSSHKYNFTKSKKTQLNTMKHSKSNTKKNKAKKRLKAMPSVSLRALLKDLTKETEGLYQDGEILVEEHPSELHNCSVLDDDE